MNKQHLIADIVVATGLPGTTVRQVIDAMTESITAYVRDGDEITLPGLGKFKTATRAARAGRNPQTGETVQIASRIAVSFAPAKALKDAANRQ